MKRALAAVAAVGLLSFGMAAPANADEPSTTVWPLTVSGGSVDTSKDIGDVTIVNTGTEITVSIEVDGEIDPDNAVATGLYKSVAIHAGCSVEDFPLSKKGNPIPGQYEFQYPVDGVTSFGPVTIPAPEGCGIGDTLVSVHANAEEPGGFAGLETILPVTGNVLVRTDFGNDPEASYFDTTLTGFGPLDGTYNGWCADFDTFITPGRNYTGTLYSANDYPPEAVDQILYPENLGLVAWLINNYRPGDSYTIDYNGVPTTRVLNAQEHIQRAVWLLVEGTTNGGNALNRAIAQSLADEAVASGATLADLECGDLIPVIVDIPGSQSTFVQTTFIEIGVPCETLSDTAMAMNWGVEVEENGEVRYGEQFAGSSWFSYVVV